MWETLHNNADWDCFGTLTLREILKTQNRPQEVSCVFLEAEHLFQSVRCARNKLLFRTVQRNVRLSLLMRVYEWMEFQLLFFAIWLLECCILLPTNQRNPKRMCRETCCVTPRQENPPTTELGLQFSTTILNYATSIMFPQTWSLLNFVWRFTFFDDNAAVIKMIIKGRSPTRRHVSRTHRVALDWLFDRINLDPKIQIKYVDTKNQLADILTEGNFTRDAWNNLLHLFNIIIFRSASCPEAMSKRMQQGTGEKIVAKSKPTLNLVSHTAASSPTALSSSASSCPGILRAPSQQRSNLIAQSAGKLVAGGSNQNDAASSLQVWLTDTKMSERARKLAAAGTNQDQNFPERARTRATENSDINDEDDSKWPHNFAYLVLTFHTSRKSTRTFDNNSNVSQKKNGGLRCEYIYMENVYDCHSTNRSSSWKR